MLAVPAGVATAVAKGRHAVDGQSAEARPDRQEWLPAAERPCGDSLRGERFRTVHLAESPGVEVRGKVRLALFGPVLDSVGSDGVPVVVAERAGDAVVTESVDNIEVENESFCFLHIHSSGYKANNNTQRKTTSTNSGIMQARMGNNPIQVQLISKIQTYWMSIHALHMPHQLKLEYFILEIYFSFLRNGGTTFDPWILP